MCVTERAKRNERNDSVGRLTVVFHVFRRADTFSSEGRLDRLHQRVFAIFFESGEEKNRRGRSRSTASTHRWSDRQLVARRILAVNVLEKRDEFCVRRAHGEISSRLTFFVFDLRIGAVLQKPFDQTFIGIVVRHGFVQHRDAFVSTG